MAPVASRWRASTQLRTASSSSPHARANSAGSVISAGSGGVVATP
ncbi:hypothetical protein [Lentzea tibetensis]|nr:hypothetical protein [Lentzea tibetensis]